MDRRRRACMYRPTLEQSLAAALPDWATHAIVGCLQRTLGTQIPCKLRAVQDLGGACAGAPDLAAAASRHPLLRLAESQPVVAVARRGAPCSQR